MKIDPEYPIENLEAMSAGEKYISWIHSFFRPHIRGSVVEVGAGIGMYSKLILQEKAVDRLTLFEPTPILCEHLQKNISKTSKPLQIFNTVFNRDLISSFDTAVYINVMEHIEDDLEEMRAIWRALKPNGKILIFVPALPFLYSENDRCVGHFRRYTRSELIKKIEQAGFNLLTLRYFDSLGVLSWLVCCKWLHMKPSEGNVSIYDNFFVPPLRFAEERIPPILGKNLLLIAEK